MKRKTHDEFICELQTINPNIKILEEYQGTHIKIQCECLVCGNKWKTTPNTLLRGCGCSECGNKRISQLKTKTHEQFTTEAKVINSNIQVIGKYQGALAKVKCKCLICNYEWGVQASHILSGHGCPVCGNSIKKTHQQFINEMNIVNSNIKIISEYINAFTKVKCKCKICSKEWEAVPNSLLNGIGCPRCKLSKGELKISKYLDNHDIHYISQYKFDNCKNERVLPFDFYLPNHNICIEYDGELHYKVVGQFGGKKHFDSVQKHDNIKTQYCQDNNIKLLRIPYWDFDNIENILKKEISHNEIN